MCVAAVLYGEGPTLAELRKMDKINPHGGGLGWVYEGDTVVTYAKGLTPEEIYALLGKLPRPTLLHFRYATHGPKTTAQCHPFPLGHWALTAKGGYGVAPAVLVHNGVWQSHHKYKPAWIKWGDVSDTAMAAYMAEADEAILDDVDWSTVVGRAKDGQMVVTRRKRWFERGPDWYSNLTWASNSVEAYTRK